MAETADDFLTALQKASMLPNPDRPIAGQNLVTHEWADKSRTLCTTQSAYGKQGRTDERRGKDFDFAPSWRLSLRATNGITFGNEVDANEERL